MELTKIICFCFKIHIPVIQQGYGFFYINRNGKSFNEIQAEQHVKKVYYRNISPFLKTLKNEIEKSEGKFRFAVSISGSTLEQLNKYQPDAILFLKEQAVQKSLEILSEPWSHTILPFIDQKKMLRQIVLHDRLMKSAFGVIPDVFIAHTPVFPAKLFKAIFDVGKKGIFNYSNHFTYKNAAAIDVDRLNQQGVNPFFLINYKASHIFHELDLNHDVNPEENHSTAGYQKMKSNFSAVNPEVILYSPGELVKPDHIDSSRVCRNVMSHFVSDPEIKFVLPSEMISHHSNFPQNGSFSECNDSSFNLADFWQTNNFQKVAIERQLTVNELLGTADCSFVEEWDLLQDMDYLFYMDDRFLEPRFSETHFSPFFSPYLAYVNYLRMTDKLMDRVEKSKLKYIARFS